MKRHQKHRNVAKKSWQAFMVSIASMISAIDDYLAPFAAAVAILEIFRADAMSDYLASRFAGPSLMHQYPEFWLNEANFE